MPKMHLLKRYAWDPIPKKQAIENKIEAEEVMKKNLFL